MAKEKEVILREGNSAMLDRHLNPKPLLTWAKNWYDLSASGKPSTIRLNYPQPGFLHWFQLVIIGIKSQYNTHAHVILYLSLYILL